MIYSGDFDSPFHDSEVEALEDAILNHPAKGFAVNQFVGSCPNCMRRVRSLRHLQVPHWNKDSLPLCSTCRAAGAKWYRDPKERAHHEEMKRRREELGIKPNPGGSPE